MPSIQGNTYSRRSPVIAAFLALLLSATALAQDLTGQLESLLSGSPLGVTSLGVHIIDTQTHYVLAELNAEHSAIPASNMKLLTSVAALHVLGRDFAFRTELRRVGNTLLIVGSGDPALADPVLLRQMGLEQGSIIKSWIAAIEQTDIEMIDSIVIDDRIFDQEFVHPAWPRDQLNRWYCAQVSGLNYHTNIVNVFAIPTKPGASPTIETIPSPSWLRVTNNGRTVSSGANTVWVSRKLGTNNMTLHGNVRWATSAPIEVAIHEPAMIFGRLFQDACKSAGLGSPSFRRAAPNEDIDPGELLAVVRTPIDVILKRCNADSHNLYAESLFKRMGYEVTGLPGSWGTGAAVIRMVLGELLGPADASFAHISDGSGMSRENKLSPELLTHLLDAAWNSENLRESLVASLPVAGINGTLKTRFQNITLENTVRAKSGYLNGVSNLSGYVIDETTGRAVCFSILVNDIPASLPIRRVKIFHEQVVNLIDDWLTGQRSPLADVEAID